MNFNKIAKFSTIFLLVLFVSCKEKSQLTYNDFYKTELFKQVQLSGIFDDSKTFVDCIPKRPLEDIVNDFENENEKSLDLKTFVLNNFELPTARDTQYVSDTTLSMSEHIKALWPVLTHTPDKLQPYSSLIPLPYPYIVPGGRFREIYYWDSYFTLVGLMVSDQEEMAQNMVDNFSFLIDSIGFIPNGNRAYYLGRSQPPFFSLMVSLVASKDRDKFMSYQKSMLREYNFWMAGANNLSKDKPANERVVLMTDSSVLNRYWDNFSTPRPESFKPDYELVEKNNMEPTTAYRNLRAGAESGWDYSSRWFKDHQNLSTINTIGIVPVDLNALLYHLELMIAQGYDWNGEIDKAREFLDKADKRRNAIQKYLWDNDSQFFVDYDYKEGKSTGVLSLAGAYPLFFKLATKAQAKATKEILENQFLAPGGFLTTLNNTGQQWDAPNGWAPLQWLTINGLYNYGYYEMGNKAAQRWLQRNREVYHVTGKMMEKYNVMDTSLLAGGGEYKLQDGFGWTNGVALALEKIMLDKQKIQVMTMKE